MGADGGRFYKGTANAIYENINYIDSYNPEYVLILSGDHIYKMDYMKMLDDHKNKKSDVTIAVIEVPWDETNRFGILNTDENDIIYEFEEKPEKAKSNLASMGIYIFNWSVLRAYLIDDENDPNSKNDFGKILSLRSLKTSIRSQRTDLKDTGRTLVRWKVSGKPIWI